MNGSLEQGSFWEVLAAALDTDRSLRPPRRVPLRGEECRHANVKITVADAEPQRVNPVRLVITRPAEAAEISPS